MPVATLNSEGVVALTNLPTIVLSSARSSACWALPSSQLGMHTFAALIWLGLQVCEGNL